MTNIDLNDPQELKKFLQGFYCAATGQFLSDSDLNVAIYSGDSEVNLLVELRTNNQVWLIK